MEIEDKVETSINEPKVINIQISKDKKVKPTIALKVKPNEYAIKSKIVLKAEPKTMSKIDLKKVMDKQIHELQNEPQDEQKVTIPMNELQDEPKKIGKPKIPGWAEQDRKHTDSKNGEERKDL
eukprot:15367113-Ditylum_brightwellii.AAC.1